MKPSWVNSSQGNQIDIVASFLLLPSQTLPLVMVGWTLIHEMYFYLVFFLALLFFKRSMPAALLMWGVAVASLNVVFSPGPPVFRLITHPLTLEFIGGCFLAEIYFRKSINISPRSLFILCFFALSASLYGYCFYQNSTGEIEPLSWWRVLIFGVPALVVVYCFTGMEKAGYVLHSSLIKVGDASYSIYLSHILTLSAAGRLWGMFSVDSLLDNIIMIPILLLVAIAGGIFSYLYIEKPLLNLSRRVA